MVDLGHGFCKIGYTRRPLSKRLKSFKTTSTCLIRVLSTKSVNAESVTQKEAQVKQMFSKLFCKSQGGTEVFRIHDKSSALSAFENCLSVT